MSSTFSPVATVDQNTVSQPKVGTFNPAAASMPAIMTAKPPVAAQSFVRNRQAVLEYGADVSEQIVNASNQILDAAKMVNVDEVGNGLTNIISIAKGFNVSDINGTSSKIPLIGPLIDRFKNSREKFVARFDTVSGQIEKFADELNQTITAISQRNKVLSAQYEQTIDLYRKYDAKIKEADKIIAEERAILENRKATVAAALNPDPLEVQDLRVHQEDFDRFCKRVDDMRTLYASSFQDLAKIHSLVSTNETLYDQFWTAKTHVIPMWRSQFVLALSAADQRKAVAFESSIKDYSNQLLKNTTQMVGQNAIDAAQSSQRTTIDIKTLEDNHKMLLDSFNTVLRINEEGKRSRADLPARIQGFEKELVATYTQVK